MTRAIRIGVALLTLGLGTVGIYLLSATKTSEVLISDRMSEFIDTVDRHKSKKENKLIVFDLDDTVFMSSQLVGTPTWYYNMINLLRQSGAANYEAYAVATAIDKIVQEKIHVVPVEQATLSAIRTWQKLSVTVVGITSRPTDVATITKHQLDQIGLDFASPYFSCIEDAWDEGEGSFQNGVLYAGDNTKKGRVFKRFFDYIRDCGLSVDLLAHADDQQRYVTKIAKFAKKNRVDYVGIIYGGALSSRVFDFSEAKKQLLGLEASLEVPIIPNEYRQIFISEGS